MSLIDLVVEYEEAKKDADRKWLNFQAYFNSEQAISVRDDNEKAQLRVQALKENLRKSI